MPPSFSPSLPLLLLAVLAAVSSASGAMTVLATDTTYVLRRGRTFEYMGGIGMSYLGGGLTVAHNGSVLTATLSGDANAYKISYYQSNEGYMPFQGISWVLPRSNAQEGYFRGESMQGETNVIVGVGPGNVTILLNDDSQYWETENGSAFAIKFTTDGSFLPLAPPLSPRTLHFVGDSITAATNVRGGYPGCHDAGYQSDYSSSWAGILCAYFGADCSTIAMGGKGLVRNCCDDGKTMPAYYQQYRGSDPAPNFPFNDTQPDAVVIYLGTNDFDDGTNATLDLAFSNAYVDFMRNITQQWYGTPDAPAAIQFFATLGPMLPFTPVNATLRAVEWARSEGMMVHVLNITTACGDQLTGCTDGCATHPGVASHRNMARLAAPVLSDALGWPLVGVL